MNHPEQQSTCVVSGSFEKFKKEIDLVIEEFEDNGVKVLAPQKGPLLIVPESSGFYPLQHERHLPINIIEDDFLACIKMADFLYVVNVHGYIGNTVGFEMGFALALGKPIYLKEPVSRFLDFQEGTAEIVWSILKVKTPTEVTKMAINRKFDTDGYSWCPKQLTPY